MKYRYWFGRPIRPCTPSANSRRPVFVLGAYPSALHVRWHPPGYRRAINAIAVDDEPVPFWSGTDERDQIEKWLASGTWKDSWGKVSAAGRLNGSSGVWLRDRVLGPLQVPFTDVWATDCLDTYRLSGGAAKRLRDDDLQALMARHHIPRLNAQRHPTEAAIVSECLEHHIPRLIGELATARPKRIVTLGNAALRVLRELVDSTEDVPRGLSADETYGQPIRARFDGSDAFVWIPLAHPGAPSKYQRAHDRWIEHASRAA